MHWLQVPVGLVPSQTLTATTLELPVQLDDEPTTPQNAGMLILTYHYDWLVSIHPFYRTIYTSAGY